LLKPLYPSGGVVILVSSRKDHVETPGEAVPGEDELVQGGVRIVSSLLGPAADTLLLDLAHRTDGQVEWSRIGVISWYLGFDYA